MGKRLEIFGEGGIVDETNGKYLFHISNSNLNFHPNVISPLGNSDHCFITLWNDFLSHLHIPLLRKRSSIIAELTGIPFPIYTPHALDIQAFKMTLYLLPLSSRM